MYIFGKYVALPTIVLSVICLVLLIAVIVVLVLYLQANGRVTTVGNSSTVTGQVVPSRYSNKNAISGFQANRNSTLWRMVFVGDFGFAQVNSNTGGTIAYECNVPFLVSNLIENSQSIGQYVVTQNLFGYDAALKDPRVTMTGDWSGASTTTGYGIGGRYFSTTSSTATLVFRPSQMLKNNVQFYALASSARFSISATSNGAAVTVTPSTITPIPSTNIVEYSYSLNNVAWYPVLTITATGATSTTPVTLFGWAQKNDFRSIVNTSLVTATSANIAASVSPTSWLNGGLQVLRPNLMVIQNPISDYTSGIPIEQSAENIKPLLDRCQALSIPVIAVTPPWVGFVSADTQQTFTDTFKAMYAKYSNVMVYDFQADMVSFDTQVSLNLSNTVYTSNYLTPLGGLRMAQGIYNALTQ